MAPTPYGLPQIVRPPPPAHERRREPGRARRLLDWPEPGFFRTRLVRGGPWVAAVIWRPCPWVEPGDGEGSAAVEDWCRPLDDPQPYDARPLRAAIDAGGAWRTVTPHEVWERGREIPAREFHFFVDRRRWALLRAQWGAPSLPEADPYKPVDLPGAPSLF